jgi:hypothetical protein
MTLARCRRRWPVFAVLALALAGCTGSSGDEPESGAASTEAGPDGNTTSWVVTLGDSYISGEGTRWAGNTAGKSGTVDAQGRAAYFDQGGRESEPGCHRSDESISDIGVGLSGRNLACSGATTSSHFNGDDFKPGLDFYDDHDGHIGQALALQRFAGKHTVSSVVISIGGNDFNFAPIVAQCAADFITTVGSKKPSYCKDDPAVTANFDADNVASVTAMISDSIVRVAGAMQRAGYGREDYSITVLTYPAPLAPGDRLRYPETLAARDAEGGCPVYDADATWALDTAFTTINQAVADAVDQAGLSNLGLLDVSNAFTGHRLCEVGVNQLSETSLGSWRGSGAVDQLEWVNMAYTLGAPWQLKESFHPNYWGMLAERSCVRQALTLDPGEYGRCEPARDGLRGGEPVMTLSP